MDVCSKRKSFILVQVSLWPPSFFYQLPTCSSIQEIIKCPACYSPLQCSGYRCFFSYFLLRRTTANKLHIIIKERNLEQTVINWWINWITWVRLTYKIRVDWWFRYGMENENIKTNIYTTKKKIYVDEYYSADCF